MQPHVSLSYLMLPCAMNYYLVIGVHRAPHTCSDDGDSYLPYQAHVSSEKELHYIELIKVFEEEVKELWSVMYEELKEGVPEEEVQDWLLDEGYTNVDYVLTSIDPFPEVDIYGTDLVSTYLGS